MTNDGRYDHLADRLEQIGEELTDAAMVQLREAIEAGQGQRPPDEKRLNQARRAIEKAAHLLRGPQLEDWG